MAIAVIPAPEAVSDLQIEHCRLGDLLCRCSCVDGFLAAVAGDMGRENASRRLPLVPRFPRGLKRG
jgi:hypothetical protein